MARIIISGEIHISKADRLKHIRLYPQAEVRFIENPKERVQLRTDILYSFFLLFCKLWLGILDYQTKNFPKKNSNLKAYEVDMDLPEIYNSVRGITKACLFLGAIAVAILIAKAIGLVLYLFLSSILNMLPEAFGLLFYQYLSFILNIFPLAIVYAVLLILLLVVFYGVSIIYFSMDARNRYMAYNIDQIMKREGYKVGLMQVGKLHTKDIKILILKVKSIGSYLKESGHTVEIV